MPDWLSTGFVTALATFIFLAKFTSSIAEALALSKRTRADDSEKSATTRKKVRQDRRLQATPRRILVFLCAYLMTLMILVAAGFKQVAAWGSLVVSALALLVVITTMVFPTRLRKVVEVMPVEAHDSEVERIIKMKANNEATLAVWSLVIAAGVPAATFGQGPKAGGAITGILIGAGLGMVYGDRLTRDLQQVYNKGTDPR